MNITKQQIAKRDKLHLVCDEVRPLPENESGYGLALYAAGVDVLDFSTFGSYQGEWWAKIQFPNREIYYVTGSYGSCSGCDAFEAEFGWGDDDKPNYAHKLKDFGRVYLTDCYTLDQAIDQASRNIDWDHDAEEMVAWLKKHGEPAHDR